MDTWDDGTNIYAQARYPATKKGAEAAEKYEVFAATKGFAPIDVQVLGGTDVGRSIAKSAAGLGLLAATGFGFLGTSRTKGEIVVTYRSVLSIVEMMAAAERS